MKNFIIKNTDKVEGSLSQEYYFQSLLQYAYSNDLLSKEQFENIQIQIIDILKETVGYYTMGESTSVRVEVAENLLLSIYYTISLFLKNNFKAIESIDLIKRKNIKEIFNKGQELLKVKFNECTTLLEYIINTKLLIKNYAYIDTIEYGIPLFFKEYNLRYESHEVPGSIDYPLANYEINLAGVEYIERYLKNLYLENLFCSNFNFKDIDELLNGYDKKSYHLLINVFKIVLTNSIGSILLNRSAKNLLITSSDKIYIEYKLKDLSEPQLKDNILMAIEKICSEFSIDDQELINYLNNISVEISHEININKIDKIDKIFITPNNEKENIIKYKDRKSIKNNLFRYVTEEIRTCNTVEDKIKIIKEDIHSLRDLVDVLGADCIFEHEFYKVFNSLEDIEIALLIKYLPSNKDLDSDYGTESEKEWHEKLKEYLDYIDDYRKKNIMSLSNKIEI
ncbi:DUF6179 domain-containing protein [Clostridium sp. C8]|uniref:DUF6179 domain-containing protein n=1 Tax=Clostridium sp. C8 TaxID=1667357 RepID=UPI00062E3E1F|nr:DUF6179 domain-containing protein [Clostridium sp. C8]KLE14197.1 hypothetical protein AAT22_17810 [Clostridium sp. C8]